MLESWRQVRKIQEWRRQGNKRQEFGRQEGKKKAYRGDKEGGNGGGKGGRMEIERDGRKQG